MRRLRAWVVRLGGLFRGERAERELAEELESHLQMHIEDNVRAGMAPEEARRQALIKLGYTVCPHRIVTRAAARRSYAVDQSVFEFEPNGKAAAEFSAVYKFSRSHENKRRGEQEKELPYA